MKTLIVEDDFITRCVLQSSLSRYGVSHIAVNGDEAVEAFRSGIAEGFPYDLVCMDIQMPGMDGKEAVRQIRAQETSLGVVSSRGVKIIMITSLDSVTEVVEAFQQLCDATSSSRSILRVCLQNSAHSISSVRPYPVPFDL